MIFQRTSTARGSRQLQLALIGILLACPIPGLTQITLSALTGNNTAACPASGKLPPHCKRPFQGQIDTRPEVATPLFDVSAGNVSDEDIHTYLTQGENTKIFANMMAGFCMNSDSGYCHNNVQTGYTSDDKKTIAAQAEDLRSRHIDGAIISWEGAGTSEDAAALKLQGYLDQKHCSGPQHCDPMYLLMYDGPSREYTVGSTGIRGTTGESCARRRGSDYENCVIAHVRNDMCYMNGKHWGNDAYLKINGRPVVLVFPDERVISPLGPAPSWQDLWTHINEWNDDLRDNCNKAPYSADNGAPLLIFEHIGGFSHAGSSGAYYWVKTHGTQPATDQFVINVGPTSSKGTLDNFYETAQRTSQIVWGAAFKGFNSSRAAWGANRIMDQECGQVWIRSLTESNKYYTGDALPFLQIATWNDYNEGTEIEAGIDNCYTVSARIDGGNLAWSLDPANGTLASLSTVSHLEIYDSRNGRDLTLLANLPPELSGVFPLSDLSRGDHLLYVRMVGKNSILNRVSAAVPFSRTADESHRR
jgi:hypothetical protein